MRLLSALVFLLPVPAIADSFSLHSKVSDVTVYAMGAKITRSTPFSIPAGQHDLIVQDLPTYLDFEYGRVHVDGARMGAMTMRDDYAPPRDETTSPEIKAAENRIEEIELQIESVKDKASEARLAAEAAQAQIGFLGQLGNSDDMAGAGLDMLRDMSRMIASEALAAQQSAHAARIESRRIERQLEDLQEDLEKAKQALASLIPEDEDRAYLAVSVVTEDAADGVMTVTYFSDEALWAPVYDMYLTRGSAASVDIERGAIVRQETGETWTDVKLTLSTVLPLSRTEPRTLYSQLRQIVKPEPQRVDLDEANYGNLALPVIETNDIVE